MLRVRKRDVLAVANAGSVVKMSPPVTLPESISFVTGCPELDELDLRQPVDLLEAEQARDPLVALGITAYDRFGTFFRSPIDFSPYFAAVFFSTANESLS